MDIETAREMLATASPWPWNHRLELRGDGPGVYKVGNAGHDIALIANTVFEDEQGANAELLSFSPATLAALILAVEALEDRCWHRELYEERSDGASNIYPSIMHEDKCSDETECEPCGACKADAAWRAL